ncbi:MAG: hypothetical protein ACREMJ_10410 [Gemmatimonadales bacterium]
MNTWRRAWWRAARLLLPCWLVATARGMAQPGVDLVLSQAPSVFPAPTVAAYDAGFVLDPNPIVFTVNASGGPPVPRTTIVSVRAAAPTLGGGKPVADLEWRRADLGTWNAISTTDAVIESRPIVRSGLNDPWSNGVFLRIRLSWATDPPGTYATPLVFTLTVTTP